MKKKRKMTPKGPTHVTHGNIFRDLGFTDAESEVYLIKARIHEAIVKHVEKMEYSRRQVERQLDEPQPRVSELMRGKIGNMSIERLLCYAQKLGLHAEVSLRKAA